MHKRDSVAKLAKTDCGAALQFASSIEEPGKRIQALGWVARFAPAARVEPIVNSALEIACVPTDDAYASVLALAWPLRALHETKNRAAIPDALAKAIELAPDVTPTSSRCEALLLLIHAVLPAGVEIANPALDALQRLCAGDDHWRIVRAFAGAALLVNAIDKTLALQIAHAMPEGNKRDMAIARLQAGESEKVRKFFW